ncbi:transcription factor Opi1-domain-containing protein [Endogone sp. FLAS-F59071]|nr:transcription factor Opi1-domain-containing protein [Endogone sp. FLAS-F59071]|eukprot:RUS14872.1 transcription factor Opi1-domain-containing protein [Endogone sp. FLAS-F59071]
MSDNTLLPDPESSALQNQQNSLMSIDGLCNSTSSVSVNDTSSGEEYDDDVQFAARTLGDMKNHVKHPELPPLSLSTSSASSTTTTTPLATPTSTSSNPLNMAGSANDNTLISRLATIPVIKTIGRAYEHTKTSSRFVQYGAEMVESTVKNVAAPLYGKLGGAQLEEWGSRQLDKVSWTDFKWSCITHPPLLAPNILTVPFYLYQQSLQFGIADSARPEDENTELFANGTSSSAMETRRENELRRRRNEEGMEEDRLTPRPKGRTRSASRSASRSTSPRRNISFSPYGSAHGPSSITTVLPPKSRWQQLVVNAGAVVSEESMRCLKYCLHWLQYAVQHIDQQIAVLRNFLIALATAAMRNNATSPESDRELVPASAGAKIQAIKKDVIDTLRKVVEVVSKYAGACLPDQAKTSVRGFILSLPGKWATLQNDRSPNTSPMSSPLLGPSSPSLSASGHSYHVQDNAQKIMTLAGESVDMLRSVSNIFSDTIERAEGWLERLRFVGVPGVPARSDDVLDTTLPPLRQLSRNSRKLPSLNSIANGNSYHRYMPTAVSSSDEDLEIDDRDSDDESLQGPDQDQRMEFSTPSRRTRGDEAMELE